VISSERRANARALPAVCDKSATPHLLISAGCANAVAVLGGLLLAVPDWARLSIRASVLPVVSRTVLMPDLQQCLQAGALSRANIARRQMTEGSYDDGGGEGAPAPPCNRAREHGAVTGTAT
jgi:hypothetical protein